MTDLTVDATHGIEELLNNKTIPTTSTFSSTHSQRLSSYVNGASPAGGRAWLVWHELDKISWTVKASSDTTPLYTALKGNDTFGIVATVKYLADHYNDAELDDLKVTGWDTWANATKASLNTTYGETRGSALFDKFVNGDPNYKANWLKKVEDAKKVRELLQWVARFYQTPGSASGIKDESLIWSNAVGKVGYFNSATTNIFQRPWNGSTTYDGTPVAITTLAQAQALAHQIVDNEGTYLASLDQDGSGQIEAYDLLLLRDSAQKALDELASSDGGGKTMSSTDSLQSTTNKTFLKYLQDNWGSEYNSTSLDLSLNYLRTYIKNINFVYVVIAWEIVEPEVRAFIAANADNDYHIGANGQDEENSAWNDVWPEKVIALFTNEDKGPNGEPLTDAEKLLVDANYLYTSAAVPFSTVEVLTLQLTATEYYNLTNAMVTLMSAEIPGTTGDTLLPIVGGNAVTDWVRLQAINKKLDNEKAYRTVLSYEESFTYQDENDVTQTGTRTVTLPGYEPAWYSLRDAIKSHDTSPAYLDGRSVSQLSDTYSALKELQVTYLATEAKAKADLYAMTGSDAWWAEIYEMAIPIELNTDRNPATATIPEHNWGKAVIPTKLDDIGYALARRFGSVVEDAMAVYAQYESSGLIKVDALNNITVDVYHVAAIESLIKKIPKEILDLALMNESVAGFNINAIKFINNIYENPLAVLPETVTKYDATIYTTGPDLRYTSVPGLGTLRTVIGDYLFLVLKIKPIIDEFNNNPSKYWVHIQEWDTSVAGSNEITGNYVTRYGDTLTVDGPTGQDVARAQGEDYTVKGTQLKSLIASLDGLAGTNGDLSKILNTLGVDLSSLGVDTSAGPVTANTIIQSALGSMLYNNDMVNTIVELLYGMVLPIFEDVFAGITSGLDLSSMPLTGGLHIFSLHSLLNNTGGTTLRNLYDLSGDGDSTNFRSEANHNTLSDLRLYPDLLGNAIDGTKFAAAKAALINPGYDIATVDQELLAMVGGAITGYKYDIDVWRAANIFKPTINPDGTISYEPKLDKDGKKIESGVADNPATKYQDESIVYDTSKPIGKLSLDWGLDNPALTNEARASLFKEAMGSALTGIYPLLQALLLGQDYFAINPKVGYLDTGSGVPQSSGQPTWATYSMGSTTVVMRVPTIYLALKAAGNDGFAKVVTPILEALAGLSGTTTPSVYNAIPTVNQLKGIDLYNGSSMKYAKDQGNYLITSGANAGLPMWVEERDQDGSWLTLGTGSQGTNVWHFARLGGTLPNYTYDPATVRSASNTFVSALFAPVDALLTNIGNKPVDEILRILPSVSYALSLQRVKPLLEGTLKLDITPDINGMVDIGTPDGCSSLIGNLANGALCGGSRMGNSPDRPGAGPPFNGKYTGTYSVAMIKDVLFGGGIVGTTNLVVMANIVPPMAPMNVDIGELVDLSSLDPFLGAGSIENLLLSAAPEIGTLLPSGLLGNAIGMYGPVLAGASIPTKRAADAQTRAYVDTETANLLYGILRQTLRPDVLKNFGLDLDGIGLGNFTPELAVAALLELHSPKAGGYAMRPVDYGTDTTVYAPFQFKDAHLNLDEATGILNKLIAALTGGVFFDLDGMIETLLGENVYNNATFDLVKDLLLGYIGPEGSFGSIVNMVADIIPELEFLKDYSDVYTAATYKPVTPLYATWANTGTKVAGTPAALDAKLPSGYAFQEAATLVDGKYVATADDPKTAIDESKVCTNAAAAFDAEGKPILSGTVDTFEHISIAWNFEVNPDAESARQYPKNFWDNTGETVLVPTDGIIKTQEDFFNCFYKLLSPLEDILRTFLVGEDFKVLNSTAGAVVTIPGYNGYEYGFVPLMEGLGFTTGLVDYTTLKAASGADFISKLFQPIFKGLETVAGDPINFVLTELPQILFFLFSGSALEDSIRNLLKTPLVLLDTVRPLISIDISEYLGYLSAEGVINQFGDTLAGLLQIGGIDLYDLIFGDNAAFLKTLIIGTVKNESSVDGVSGASNRLGTITQEVVTTNLDGSKTTTTTTLPAEDGKYPNITVEPAEYFFSILIKVFNYLYENDDLLGTFLEDENMRTIILSFLDTLQNETSQHALFDVLYQLLYGAHDVKSPSDVYEGYATITPGTVTYDYDQYGNGWSEAKAQKFVSGDKNKELDLVLNAILGLLPDSILPAGSRSTTDIINGFLTGGQLLGSDVMDPPVFSTEFFNQIKDLIVGIGSNESLAGIIDIADDYITTLDINAFLHPRADLGSDINSAVGLDAKAAAFKAAIVELLDPLAPLFQCLLTNTSLEEIGLYDTLDDTTHIAGCEKLIKISGYYGYIYGLAPILAAIGVQVPSFDEVNNASNPLDPILDAIIATLSDVAESPITFVLDNLPNILAFVEANAASKAVKQLITPVYALATAVNPLVIGMNIEVNGAPLDIIGMVDDVLKTLDLKALINDFLGTGIIAIGEGIELNVGNIDDIIAKLIVGVKDNQNDKEGTQLIVPTTPITEGGTANYPATRVDSNREDAFTALVEFIVSLIGEDSGNRDALAALLGGEIPSYVLTVLNNLEKRPQTLLDILYTIRFGADVSAPADIWSGYSDIAVAPFSPYDADKAGGTSNDWSETKATQFIEGLMPNLTTSRNNKELDLIANWVLKTLEVKDLQGKPVETSGDLLNSVLGEYLYSPQLFNQIVAALQSLANNESVTEILAIVEKALPSLDLQKFLEADIDLSGLSADKTVGERKTAFIAALKELLEPIAPLLNVFLAGGSLEILDIDPEAEVDPLIKLSGAYGYNYGIVPLLEALGCDPNKILTYAQYQTSVTANDPITPLLDGILSLIETIAENPIDWALENVPNIVAFASDTGALFKVLSALLAPVSALANAVTPLVMGETFEIPVIGSITIDDATAGDIVGSILSKLDVREILQNLLGDGIDISGQTLAIDVDAIINALLVGEVKTYATKAVDTETGDALTTSQRIVSDKPGLLTSLVTFLLKTVGENKPLIASLLGGTITEPINTILDNVIANPQAVLNILHKLRFGVGVTEDFDIYGGYDNKVTVKAYGPYYVSPFSEEKAAALVQGLIGGKDGGGLANKKELDLIADWALQYLGVADSTEDLISGIVGEQLYGPDLFAKIVEALQSVASNESVASILDIADEYLNGIDLSTFMKAEIQTPLDGTRANFEAALTELLAPIAPLLNVFLAGESFSTIDIDPTGDPDDFTPSVFDPLIRLNGAAGYNNGIVPILEALGATPISYSEYRVNAIAGDPIGPIVKAILDLAEAIYTNPIDWALTNIPNIVAFAGDSGALANSLDALLAPVYGLVEAVNPLIQGVDLGIDIDLNNIAGDILPTLNIRSLVTQFLGTSIAINDGFSIDLDFDEIFDALLIGKIDKNVTSASTNNGGKRTAIISDKPGLLTSLVSYLFSVAAVEKDQILELLGVTLTAPLDTILDNAVSNPQAVLNLIYHVKFGVYVDGKPLDLDALYATVYGAAGKTKPLPYDKYDTIWSKTMAEKLVLNNANADDYNKDDLAAIADAIVSYLTGKTLGQTLKDIVGEQVYNPDLFQKIVDAINSVVSDPNLAGILSTVDELLDGIDLADFMDLSDIDVAATADPTGAGFKAALKALLDPIAPLLKVFLAGESYKTIQIDLPDDPDDTLITISGYNGYVNGIAPILEALGADVPGYAEIQAVDNPLEPIINSLLDLLNTILANPVDWVLTNLPNLAAFIDTGALNKCLEQILTPVLALAETVDFLFKGVEINGKVLGDDYKLADLAGSLLDSLDLKGIISGLLEPGIVIGGQTLTLDSQGLIDALLIGTLNGHTVTSDKAGLFTNLVEYLLGTAVPANKGAIAGLLGGEISEPIAGILTNATTNPKLVLRILYNFLYGIDSAQTYITYDNGSALGISAGGSAIYREEWWTREHAKYVWNRADDFVNKLWAILFGKPLGSIKGMVDGATDSADTFLGDLLGEALFTQQNLTMIVNLVKDNVPDGLLSTEVLGKTLGELLKEGVFITGANGPEALDLEAILAPFNEYTPAKYPVTDRDSFIAALVELLTPAVPVLDVLLAGSDINIVPRLSNGTGPDGEEYVVNVYGAEGYKYGLLPLLEAIGIGIDKDAYLAQIATPDEFAGKSGGDKLYAIINPLLWVLEQVVSNPVENVLRIVPNLIYTVDGTNLQSCINKLLEPVNDVLIKIDGLYHIDPISVNLNIPALLNGVLEGTGLEITYDSLKALLIGDLKDYASRNGAPEAKYISVDSTLVEGDNFMPDMLTVLLRFLVMTFVATKQNQQIVLDYLVSNGLNGAGYQIVKQTVDDIFVFIREGHISDIHGRYVLGADIFLNATFVLFYGFDKVVCSVYAAWESVNDKIRESYKHLIESNSAYDVAYANNVAVFTKRYFPGIINLDPNNPNNSSVAPNGFIQFWLTLVAWFKKIFGFLFP
jgi:hypothetical protein